MDHQVAQFLEESQKSAENTIQFSTGVILEILPVSPMLALKVSQKYKEPPVPTVRDMERGVDIPNPMDDVYIQEKEDIKMAQGQAILDVLIGLGTKVKVLPAGFFHPDDPAWSENIEILLDEPIDPRPLLRYLAWVRYIACVTNEDFQELSERMYSQMGVSQAEVNTALSSPFPANNSVQPANPGSALSSQHPNGD